ncbi:MAG TPA: HAD family hydrolase [Bacteroidales bacterium]|nr:HAD family hydrolase [Bacteroidales bacterium]
MNKAVFLDRDGVVNKEMGKYVFLEESFVLNKDLIQSLRLLIENHFLIIIITNQGGIAKGIYTKDNVEALHKGFVKKMEKEKIHITDIYYCPHHPDIGKCLCRKPGSLMLEKAIARYNIDVSESFMIGDSDRDIEAAEKVNVKAIKIEANTSILSVCKEIIRHSIHK